MKNWHDELSPLQQSDILGGVFDKWKDRFVKDGFQPHLDAIIRDITERRRGIVLVFVLR